MRGKRRRGESSERSTAPQMITEFLFKKKETEKKMHKKRNMHDFPIYHCLTSFEHVCKDLRGRMGKEEFGRGGGRWMSVSGLWNRGVVGWARLPDKRRTLYFLLFLSLMKKGA